MKAKRAGKISWFIERWELSLIAVVFIGLSLIVVNSEAVIQFLSDQMFEEVNYALPRPRPQPIPLDPPHPVAKAVSSRNFWEKAAGDVLNSWYSSSVLQLRDVNECLVHLLAETSPHMVKELENKRIELENAPDANLTEEEVQTRERLSQWISVFPAAKFRPTRLRNEDIQRAMDMLKANKSVIGVSVEVFTSFGDSTVSTALIVDSSKVSLERAKQFAEIFAMEAVSYENEVRPPHLDGSVGFLYQWDLLTAVVDLEGNQIILGSLENEDFDVTWQTYGDLTIETSESSTVLQIDK